VFLSPARFAPSVFKTLVIIFGLSTQSNVLAYTTIVLFEVIPYHIFPITPTLLTR
jgi:hypothetical protein